MIESKEVRISLAFNWLIAVAYDVRNVVIVIYFPNLILENSLGEIAEIPVSMLLLASQLCC